MPNTIKVGFTKRSVTERASELSSSTGVPQSFRIEYWRIVMEPEKVESKVHDDLSHYRVSDNREFFEITVDDAIAVIEGYATLDNITFRAEPLHLDSKEIATSKCTRCGHQWIKTEGNSFCEVCW
jgi:T5orf172 domain.